MEEQLKKAIVITSIFEPTAAVKKFADLENYRLFVAGDKKTNPHWTYGGVEFISWEKQRNDGWSLSDLLPDNHYCRKLFGYLAAMAWGADVIIDTDDDNIPYDDWQFPAMTATYDRLPSDAGFVNIYQWFTKQHIWPRGLPLQLLQKKKEVLAVGNGASKVGIWQGLADNDPDVDAIYRLTSDTPCFFDNREPLVLPAGTLCPFNSQNTLFVRELFPLLYLPATVSFRFTDILRGLVAQPIMWLYGFELGFTKATVEQLRNPHDYFRDFESEMSMFLHGYRVPGLIASVISVNYSMEENMIRAYECLLDEKLVSANELTMLDAWLYDAKTAAKG